MNEKEVGELRRRFRPERNGITHIRGCYVNEIGEIVAQFDQSLALLSQEETETCLGLLRRTLSGTLGKNLHCLEFATRQVAQGEEHKLLMALRDSALREEEAVQAFFQKVIGAVQMEGNYLILLVHDTYDVPYRAKDGQQQDDASAEVYSHILCSICPVKQTKPALSYQVRENEFHNRAADWLVAPPELGFLFPAFDERTTNLYGALYYTRDSADAHPDLVQAVFQCPVPMAADTQRETFQSMLEETLGEECSYDVVQAVHDQMCELIQEHKDNHEEEPLTLSKGAVKCVLRSCGVSDKHVEEFDTQYDDQFGADTALSPRNLVENKLEVTTPDVVIKVSPERSDLVQTRVIDGVKYILIRAEEGVEVNGVSVQIP